MDWTIKRGDVFYVEREDTEVGSEQRSGRPAIVVSNNAQNSTSDVVQVVYLTTKPKTDLPTHVTIRSTNLVSIALCEQICSIDISRLGDWKCTCSDTEMEAVNAALATSLALDLRYKTPTDAPAAQKNEAAFWKEMYNNLLDKVLGKG